MTRDELIEAMARAALDRAWGAPRWDRERAADRVLWCQMAEAQFSALETARPDIAAVLRGEGVVVPMTDDLRNQIAIAKLCAPIRSYPGTGGLWFGRNDQMTDADFRDWGAARAFAAIVTAMIAAGERR